MQPAAHRIEDVPRPFPEAQNIVAAEKEAQLVHAEESGVVGVKGSHHDEQVLGVPVDLGALPDVSDVLDGEGMKSELERTHDGAN